MPRMRTIDQAAAWMKENDPETALTKTALRRLVSTGQIPSVRIGQGARPKYLLALEVLEDYLHGTASASMRVHGIREVKL